MNLETAVPKALVDFSQKIPAFTWNIAICAAALLIGLAIKFVITRILLYYTRENGEYSFFRSVVIHLGTPVTYFIPLFLLDASSPLMRMDKIYFQPLEKVITILITVFFASILINSIKILEDYIYHAYDLSKTDNLKERKVRTQIQFLRKFIIVMIVFITIAIILLSFDSMRKIGTGLLTGVGIGGIIVGFAAQSSLGNLLAGFQIAFTQPIRIDDVLVVEGEWGRVEDITLTYVVLKIWDERRLILPINYFIQKPFQNWTRMSSEIMGTVFLYMDYSIPIEELRAEFKRLLDNSPLWDKRVSAVQVTDAKEQTLEIRFLISANNSSNAFDLRCYIRENMIAYIQKNYPGSLPKHRAELNNDNLHDKNQTSTA